MKLASASEGQVVRNADNGSHYRFERMEAGRARIRPLELFPNGLLIAKPTPTTIDPDIPVIVVGVWQLDMVVEGKPSNSRRVYENELVRKESELVELQEAYEKLPVSGKGTQSRGSWANKVKSCKSRIEVLKRGLGFVDTTAMLRTESEPQEIELDQGQLVQLPSGRAAKVEGFQPMGDQTYVQVKTFYNGTVILAALPAEVLRCASQARVCTV